MLFTEQQQYYQNRIAQYLQKLFIATNSPLNEAFLYSTLNGGKRLRPILVYTTGEALGADIDSLDIPASAIELIHTFSLLHDDLPAMDNDDFRRGRPTCHKQFNEAIAILAGDALQSISFKILSTPNSLLSAQQQIHMIEVLSQATTDMAYGQALDLNNAESLSTDELDHINLLKTGALIEASVLLGAIAANCQDKLTLETLRLYARNIGLAFQIQDDILDLEQDIDNLAGKKTTYPAILGIEVAKKRMQQHYDKALSYLNKLNLGQSALAEIADFVISRHY